ncbi:hypothetical protein CYLTODRAFT_459004 [Cylindrobasidium torrendii FP15055 ss-10]|uniref:Transcription factor domain-containing protein n=1 Tax=Cylindrobasidium torrendii FP15055 ss-10 TaxID=1314674 RepID=A0A0D7AWQ1_9AGAR|nr:hypothetical protein CYLTODRAFT_459004 [Cylindrobasidium torrendii FP15055 ss-10]
MSGVGLKIAQDLVLPRLQPPKRNMRQTEHELDKRAFWVLIWLNQNGSLTVHHGPHTTEPPILCDDEYRFARAGEDPPEQPPEQPSKIVFFVEYLRVKTTQVLASSRKSSTGLAQYSAKANPKQISSVMDPHREDIAFFQQSAALSCAYNRLQHADHRPPLLWYPMISNAQHPSSAQAFANLALCTNVARRQQRRGLLVNAAILAMRALPRRYLSAPSPRLTSPAPVVGLIGCILNDLRGSLGPICGLNAIL